MPEKQALDMQIIVIASTVFSPLHTTREFLFFFFKEIFIYSCLAALGLHCCAWAFSSCGERGLRFVAEHGLLTAVASHCRARALGVWASVDVARGLSSCGSRALEHRLSSCGARV